MNIFSGDGSIIVNKTLECYYDLRVNPAVVSTGGGTGGGGPIAIHDTESVALTGNGVLVPLGAAVKLSTTTGNQLSLRADGLYVPAPGASYSDTQARAAISAITPLQYNAVTGVISVLTANNSQSGVISFSDWNLFNSKANTAANVGSGIGIFKQKNVGTIELRSLSQGTGISISQSGDNIVISSSVPTYTDANARNSITTVAPIAYNSSSGIISLPAANGTTSGYLTNTDWTKFNSSVPQTRNINTVGPLSGGGNLSADLTLSITQSSPTSSGFVSTTDYNYFAGKQDAIAWQSVTAASNKITLGGNPSATVKNAFSIDVIEANLNRANFSGISPISGGGTGATSAPVAINNLMPSQVGNAGKVLGTDGSTVQWVTGGAGGGGGESPLTFTLPLTRTTNTIGINLATSTQDGYLSSSNFNYFSNKITDGANIGTVSGANVLSGKNGTNLEFRRLINGSNIIISQVGNDISIGAFPTGGGSTHAINTTVAELVNNPSPNTSLPYYVTDPGREGFFYYDALDTTTANNGYGICIINVATGKRWKRSYVGPLEISWFDTATQFVNAKANYAYVGPVDGSGSFNPADMTGIDCTPALDNMMRAAKDNEPCHIQRAGTGWLFATKPAVWDNSKTKRLIIDGDTYHPAIDFIEEVFSSGIDRHHYVEHNGRAIGRENMKSQTQANTVNHTGPDWTTFTGDFLKITNISKRKFKVNYVTGFANMLHIRGQSEGCQETYFEFIWSHKNACGVRMTSVDGSSYCDKLYCQGGRFSGGIGVVMDGYQPYIAPGTVGDPATPNAGKHIPYNGAFRANYFVNCLFEFIDKMIDMRGECTENVFFHCSVEAGVNTGVFDPFNAIFLRASTADNDPGVNDVSPNYCRNTVFYSCECLDTEYFVEAGRCTQIIGASMWVPVAGVQASRYVGYAAESDDTGRLTIKANTNQGLTFLPTNRDWITTKGTPKPTSQHIYARLNGIFRSVSYDGVYQNVVAGGDTTVSVPIGYLRVAAGAASVNLLFQDDQIFDGQTFYIEQTGTGTIQMVKQSSTTTVILSTTAITVPGIWFVRSVGGTFSATQLAGAGGSGGGVTSFVSSTAGNANPGTVSGSVATLYSATATQAGLLNPNVVNQVIGGTKVFNNSVTLSALAGSTTRMVTVDSTGLLGAATIPTGGTGGVAYTFSTGLSESGGVVTNNLLTGIAAGTQVVTGSITSGGNLELRSTTHATKGQVVAQDTILLRANTTAAGTAGLQWTVPAAMPNKMTLAVNGAWEWDGVDWWATNQIDGRVKLLTSETNAVVRNLTWWANTIDWAYGGTGLSTLGTAGQVLTVNSGATGLQWSTPSSAAITIYSGNGTVSSARTVTQGSNFVLFSGVGELQKYGGNFRVANAATPISGTLGVQISGNTITGQSYSGSAWTTALLNVASSINGSGSITAATGLFASNGGVHFSGVFSPSQPAVSGDADYTVNWPNGQLMVKLSTITADRTVFLPTSGTLGGSGLVLIIKNQNSGANIWQTSMNMRTKTDTTTTIIPNDTVMWLAFNGTDYDIIMQY